MCRLLLFILLSSFSVMLLAQGAFKYHRSSMYSILLKHENKPFTEEIETAFKAIPMPEKFDNHNLSKQVFNAAVLQQSDTIEEGNQKEHIDKILSRNAIGRRLVAKWFNRDKKGIFNCNLLAQRGYYNADAFDIALADRTILQRNNILRDAGKELISNTYVIVHDIQYYDRRKTGKLLSNIVTAVGTVASAIPAIGLVASSGTTAAMAATERVSGFKVSVTSYLYKLDWNDDIEEQFYNTYYTSVIDAQKNTAFQKEKSLFTLQYVGKQTVYSEGTTMNGVNKQEEFFIKVCTRAMDEAIAMLQKSNEGFRVKTPLLSTEPIMAKIGVKEAVDDESLFEVLEVLEEDGMTTYKRVGIIRPIKDKIWDNRYLAEYEDENKDKSLAATEFEKVSGGEFYPGMLVREINK